MPADKLLPETVNCWISGLTEAVPAQAEMLPVTVPAVMARRTGSTVIVNVTGELLQPGPGEIKFPMETGAENPAMVDITVSAAVLITQTEAVFVTTPPEFVISPEHTAYTRPPSGLTDIPQT